MSKQLKVLVVEDSQDDALLLIRELKRGGYEPEYERVDTPEAMSVALDSRKWDIVISDYMMPRFSGLEALKLLKKKEIDVPFIIVSGKIGEDTAVEAMKAGAQDYINKGNLARLIPAIERELIEAQDRIKRKLAEEAQKEQYSTLRSIIDSANALIFSIDRQYRYTSFNKGHATTMKALYGVDIEYGHSLLDYMIVPEDRKTARQNLDRALAGEQLVEESYSGEELRSRQYFQVSHSPVKTETGEIIGVAVLAQDITERKRTEGALRESEAKYRRIVDTANEGVWMIGEDLLTTFVNARMADLIGYRTEEMIGRPVTDFMFDEDAPDHHKKMENRRRGLAEHYERRYRHKNGQTVWTMASAVPILDSKQNFKGTFAMFTDITKRKRAEEELQKYRDHLEELVKERTDSLTTKTNELNQANIKLKELDKLKSMFIASMSHELRTPLNSIIGFSGMTLQGLSGELNEEQRDNLTRVTRSAEHLLALINDIIDISKIEAGRVEVFPENFSLHELIAEAVHTIRPLAGQKGLAIVVEVPTDIKMNTDRKRLLQCIINYMSNAIKFTEVGKVTIQARSVNGDVEISVIDTGIGITEKNMPQLFEAFERLESHLKLKAGGTGLGLYLTKKMATELLHGSVGVESIVGKGSTFSLRIPEILPKEGEIK